MTTPESPEPCNWDWGNEDPNALDWWAVSATPPRDDGPDWHCICGSGDQAEWHSLMCVASNTPDEEWYS